MANRLDFKHVRRLLGLNRHYRNDLLELVKRGGLDPTILVFR
jgi:hypothetical protein